jgi:hypothetical protein
MMRKTGIAVLIAFVLMLVTAVGAYAITNGEPDGGRHPYVGLLVFDFAPGEPGWRCSGALISPTVVLTAGHCTDGAVAARIWFNEDVTYECPLPCILWGGGSSAVEDPYQPELPVGNPCSGGNGLPAFSYRDVGVVVLKCRGNG